MERLEDIGFYTLEDYRAQHTSKFSPLWRCELLLTDKCNFKCLYCRGLRKDCRGTVPKEKAFEVINLWASMGLKNVRFSGGEPIMYPHLRDVIRYAHDCGIERIAISTNGSANLDYYLELYALGVNDFSISLDACCVSFAKKMSGGKVNWDRLIENIRELSRVTYVTVGIVFTGDNADQAKEIIELANNLGVSDIRIISSAQYNKAIEGLNGIDNKILKKHPILNYRVQNYRMGRHVRGISEKDTNLCFLVLDDMAIAGDWHFPCIIYLREGGNPIGKISRLMREERNAWFRNHNTHKDKICKENCLDVCIDYNNTVRRSRQWAKTP